MEVRFMKKYGYKTVALGGILAGSLIAAPSVSAHGGKYLNSGETSSQSYSWNDETASPTSDTFSSDNSNSFSSNDENPQFSNDSNPYPNSNESDRTAMHERLNQDRDQLAQDMRNGASDDQIAEDERAIEQDQQALEMVAFNGDGSVVVIPGS
jgi:hypothetical protein